MKHPCTRILLPIIVLLITAPLLFSRTSFKPSSRRLIVAKAQSLLGKKVIHGKNGTVFHYDCSGFIQAVYSYLDISFTDPVARQTQFQSLNIYKYCKKNGTVFIGTLPKPGDIIFFDNTYDRNKNNRLDDRITHVGLVERVQTNHTITFIHVTTRKGIIRGYINTVKPTVHIADNSIINSFLRARRSGDTAKTRYLAGELVHAYGSIIDHSQ